MRLLVCARRSVVARSPIQLPMLPLLTTGLGRAPPALLLTPIRRVSTLSALASGVQVMRRSISTSAPPPHQSLTSDPATLSMSKRLDQVTADLARIRTILDEADKRAEQVVQSTLKVSGSHFVTNFLFLLYVFIVSTWMLLLLTDLSSHVHGMPVVRMIHIKPDGKPEAAMQEPTESHDGANLNMAK